MSSLIFAHAKSIYNKAEKAKNQAYFNGPEDEEEEYKNIIFDNIVKAERYKFKKIISIAKQLHEDYVEITNLSTTNWYFITIRPDEKKINFTEFFKKVQKYSKRACVNSFYISFEQKGLSIETLGQGFHCHMIIYSNIWRSKGECLRDTKSSFASCTAPNCIDVSTTRNPEEIKEKYLLSYESKDNHKECTKNWDTLWRSNLGIKSIYENIIEDLGEISSIKSGTDEISI